MDINIWQYLTFWNVLLVILALPLVTMLITMPFLGLISKGINEWLNILGIFGFIANCIVIVRLTVWTLASVIAYYKQKPQLFSEITNGQFRMVKHYEPFDSSLIVYLTAFVVIAITTWVVLDVYSTRKKLGRLGKKYSEENPLNLNV